jgi:hypothetical protein
VPGDGASSHQPASEQLLRQRIPGGRIAQRVQGAPGQKRRKAGGGHTGGLLRRRIGEGLAQVHVQRWTRMKHGSAFG